MSRTLMSRTASSRTTLSRPDLIDPRGPRFGAWVTSAVLAGVLLLSGGPAGAVPAGLLLAAQAVVFALGTRGRSPYVLLWRQWLRRGQPAELEAGAPPRFAQLVGLAFAVVGALGFLTGLTFLGQLATAFALIAALLNAAVGLCLGCELFVLYKRSVTKGATA